MSASRVEKLKEFVTAAFRWFVFSIEVDCAGRATYGSASAARMHCRRRDRSDAVSIQQRHEKPSLAALRAAASICVTFAHR